MAIRCTRHVLVPVAQYLRMSTEHQRYSTTNQREAIAKYVAKHGMKVVRTYEDSGKSGLTLHGRPALQQLLDDVNRPRRRFHAVIVYDVSRWGRFQDVDESAYYEFVCRRAGVQVVYCAEHFGAVHDPMAVVIKSVKRAMAAEYSRELGSKVCAGQSQLTRRGFHMGGAASFGLRRVLVSESGEVRGRLNRGELKSIHTDRVILEPADPLDVALIRHIFGLFVRKEMSEGAVARTINWSCYPGRVGLHPWRADSVRDVLRNEAYVGNLVYNKRTGRLKTPCVKNAPDKVVRAVHCFAGLVSQATFDAAQRLLVERGRSYWARAELLNMVRRVHAEHGFVTPGLVADEGVSSTLFIHHFGSLADACDAAGFQPGAQLERQRELIRIRHAHKAKVLEALSRMCRRADVRFYCSPQRTCRVDIESGPRVAVRLATAIVRKQRADYWVVSPDRRVHPDFTLVARIDRAGTSVLDYFLLPSSETRKTFVGKGGRVSKEIFERYRHSGLTSIFQELERTRQVGNARVRRESPLACVAAGKPRARGGLDRQQLFRSRITLFSQALKIKH